ncbi:hypothetical protein ABN763_04380 [Spongiivirga sp. MCCC 1A20706]|uniref:hypothetical protein n=1 Tax=Spongiivirga sp. MCCC 1A20706 TaxID=3160963 RepID=UPI00397736F8
MKDELENSLINSIGKENLENIAIDYGEIALDSLITNNTLKDIPVINTVIAIAKTGLSVRDSILMKKILLFLFETKSMGYKEKKEFMASVNYESKYRTRVGEQLMIFLDKVDDFEKPRIIGRLFKNLVNKNISYDLFLRLCSITIRSFTPDFKELARFSAGKEIETYSIENLTNQGLLSVDIENKEKKKLTFKGIEEKSNPNLKYKMNQLSELFLKYGLS